MRRSFVLVFGAFVLAAASAPGQTPPLTMPDASPVKWHLAHTTWFLETFILAQHSQNYTPFDPRYTYLFNSYYKKLGGHPLRGSRGLN